MVVRPPARAVLGALLTLAASLATEAPAAAEGPRGWPDLSRLWTARYNGPGHGGDLANSVAIGPDGAVAFVAGSSPGSGTGSDYASVAYDLATGARRWVARYNGPTSGNDYADALALSPDGDTVFVTGNSFGTGGDGVTVAYEAATGSRRWVARYNGPGNGDDATTRIVVSPDGATVFAAGYSFGVGDDMLAVAWDAATGARRWVARYNDRGDGDERAYGLSLTPDGTTVLITGYANGVGSQPDIVTIAFDAVTGVRRWLARYDGSGLDDVANDLTVSPDGATAFVTGASYSSGANWDFTTLAYEVATGARRWAARYNGPGNFADLGTALRVSPDGSTLFVTGDSAGSGLVYDYATIAYDSTTGSRLWLARYDALGTDDFPYAILTNPDGSKVFVTGGAPIGPGNPAERVGTVAYDAATGNQLGVASMGPGVGYALAVSPNGTTLLVAGVAGADGSDEDDFGTLAYSLTVSRSAFVL